MNYSDNLDNKFWYGFGWGGGVGVIGALIVCALIAQSSAPPHPGNSPISLTQPSAWCHSAGRKFVLPEPYDTNYGFWATKWDCAPGWQQHPLK